MDRPPTPTPSPVVEPEPVNFDSILPASQNVIPLAKVGFVPFSGAGRRLDGK